MSYFIRLGKEAKRKISEWRLPADGIRAILRRIEELSDIPVRYGLRRISPADLMFQSDIVYRGSKTFHRDYIFTLAFRYRVDDRMLTIVDCDRLRSDAAH